MTSTLATLSLYSTPGEFLDLLILRYNVPLPKDKSDDSLARYSDNFQAPIRLRVVNALKAWVQGYWHHFAQDPVLRDRLISFVNGTMHDTMPQFASGLDQEIQHIMEYGEHSEIFATNMTFEPPIPYKPVEGLTVDSVHISQLSPIEVQFLQCVY